MSEAVDICICTFRRPHIAQTLRSIACLNLPQGLRVRVIVADNDDTPSARKEVEKAAQETDLRLTYIHAPARNISIARNACLDAAEAPYIAFIDDDELACENWLAALLAAIERTGADAVLGPVRAVYGPDCPAWMRRGDFHSVRPVWAGGKIITGYSCNVLIRREAPALKNLRFRSELGRTGGEDTAFFTAMHRAGGRIVFASDALVTEQVAPERARLGWLLKRRFRSGQTHALLLLEKKGRGLAARLQCAFAAAAKAAFCFCAALLRGRRWLLRGALHAGALSFLLGGCTIEQYGTEGVAS